MPSSSMALEYDLVVEALPAYEVGAELGRGAWGVVLAGEHRQLRRRVAIKQLPRELGADSDVRARFLSEARTLASFDHPHIVHINDFVEYNGVCLLIMDQLTGGTVGTRFRTVGFTPEAACALTLAACAGLQYAHERGVLHRDVKPENLMFSGEGVPKVVDFGIAKLVGSSSIMATRAGTTLGTPAYIAPEQARGAQLSPATDVYSIATVLYELLSGRLAYPEVTDPVAALYQHIHEDPRPVLEVNTALPPELAAVVDGALARDPALRPQSAESFGRAIAEAATDAWGLGWSAAAGVPLRGDGTMLLPSGERRVTGLQTDPTHPPSPPTVVRPATQAAAAPPPTPAPPSPAPPPPAPPPPGPPPPGPPPPGPPPPGPPPPGPPPPGPPTPGGTTPGGPPPPFAPRPPPRGGPPGLPPPMPPYVRPPGGGGRRSALLIGVGALGAIILVVIVLAIIAANSSSSSTSSFSGDTSTSIDTGTTPDTSATANTPDTTTPPDTTFDTLTTP